VRATGVVEGSDCIIHELDRLGEPRNGDVQQLLKEVSGTLTVPQIFIGGAFVCGGDDAETLLRDGTLKRLLIDAGCDL
tara:strand:- start:304 stop:537 length:234 start_codon:yes stop_codon:yes gene_type:complete